jgi:TP901 family phage tail tape measure protein
VTAPLSVSLKINVDARQGETNLGAFRREAVAALQSIGKTRVEIKAIEDIARQVREGKLALASLAPEYRKLVAEFNKGVDLNQGRDFLGLTAHQKIAQDIADVKAAYARMAASGGASYQEMAQAALRTRERVSELEEQTNGWTSSLGKAKAALAGLAAATGGLAYVAREAIRFESAMAGVAKVVDGTDEEIARLSERLREIGQEMPVAGGMNGLAGIAEAGGQLGIPIERMEEFVVLTVKMANAFQMTAGEAGQASAVIMNSFGLPLARVREVADAVNVLGNSMATTERAIIEVMTRVGGSARQFGLSAEQAAALAASLLSLGKSSMVVGTSINALLSRLQTANVQGDEFKEMLGRMGLSAEQLAADIREKPQQALLDFLKTLSRMDGQSRSEALVKLFGQEYQDDVAALVGVLDQYEAALGRVSDRAAVAGSLEAEYQKRMKTTQAQIDLLKQGFEDLAIALGSAILPVIAPIIKGLGDMTRALAEFAKTFPEIARAAEILATVAVAASGAKVALLAMNVLGTKAIGGLVTDIKALHVEMGVAAKEIGKLKIAFDVAAATMIGWEIGTSLKNEFLVVEQAGIALAAGMTRMAERVSAAFEIIKNPAKTSAILDEMRQKLAAIDDEYAELFRHAEERRKTPLPLPSPPGVNPADAPALPPLKLNSPEEKGKKGKDTVLSAYESQLQSLARSLAEANQSLTNAQNGVDEATRKSADALEIWLSTQKEAQKLSPAQIDTLRRQAAAVDGATEAWRQLVAARKRAEEIRTAGDALGALRLHLSGNTAEADRRELEARYKDLREKLDQEITRSNSLLAHKVKADVEAVIRLTLDKQQVDRTLAGIQAIQTRLSQAQSVISTHREVGISTDMEASEQLLAVNLQYAQQLKATIPDLERMAALEGDMGQAARAALIETQNQIKLLENTATLFEATLKQGVSEGLTQAIGGLVDGTMNLREAIHQLSTTIFQSLMEMYAKNLARQAANGLMSILPGLPGSEGAGDAAGTAAAASLARLTTTTTGAAAAITGLGTAAASAAAALAGSGGASAVGAMGGGGGFLDAIGGLFGFARGGYTGAGGKYQPAGIVHAGEFVARKEVVGEPGALAFLDAFNRHGMRAVEALFPRRHGYADGGLVLPAAAIDSAALMRDWRPQSPRDAAPSMAARTHELNVYNYWDIDAMAQALGRNPHFEKTVVNAVGANGNKIQRTWQS